MIKALLVDDEEWIRLGIRNQINWGLIGIEIIGEASNGIIALEMMEQYNPQIVLSDIKMPMMDGIQLMEAVHLRYPDTIIIVISGYSDFEYARKAISFQVFDYILKPIEEEKLDDTLIRAVQKIMEEGKKKNDLLHLNLKLNESAFLAREKFLTQLVQGSELSMEESHHFFLNYPDNLDWPRLIVVVFSAKNFDTMTSIKYKNDTDLTRHVLFNFVLEQFQDYDNTILFTNYSKPNELILIKGFNTVSPDIIITEIYTKSLKVTEEVNQNLQLELYAGIGRECMSIKEVSTSYMQAMEALQHVGIIQGKRILTFDEVKIRNEYFIYPGDKEKTFIYYLENTLKSQIFMMIEDLLQEIKASQTIHLQSIRNTIWNLTNNIRQVLKNYNGILEEVLQEDNIHETIMKDLFTLDELKEWLVEASSKAMYFIAGKKKLGSKKSIEEIVTYLHANYSDNVNLSSVSDIFFLNPDYLSRMFKSETGYNFNEYLNKVRMDAAIKLLKRDDLNMNHISQMVGYGNVTYFFKRFKSIYGCTPTEYKKR